MHERINPHNQHVGDPHPEAAGLLSEQALSEFKAIWLAENGWPISDELAVEEAIALLTLFRHIYKPLRKDWLAAYNSGSSQKKRSAAEPDDTTS